MKYRRQDLPQTGSSGNSSISPIRKVSSSSNYVRNSEDVIIDNVNREEQDKFMKAMGGAFRKAKEEKREFEEKKPVQNEKLKKMPAMIVPDLGPDFRHEVKFNQSCEGQQVNLKRISQKSKGKEIKVRSSETLGDNLDIEA